jgi:hypothetical protein
MNALKIILGAAFLAAVLAKSPALRGQTPPSSCGFGIHVAFESPDSSDKRFLEGDYVVPEIKRYPLRVKYFPGAHIKIDRDQFYNGDMDKWMTLGCEYCNETDRKSADGKWSIWQTNTNNNTGQVDTLPLLGNVNLVATCDNCPAAGGPFPWSATDTWIAAGSQHSYRSKGTTKCCDQACLQDTAKCETLGLSACISAECCGMSDIGCLFKGPGIRRCTK